jgi:hypothetical protein
MHGLGPNTTHGSSKHLSIADIPKGCKMGIRQEAHGMFAHPLDDFK